MGDRDAPPLQLERLLGVLAAHRVEYLVVGGVAAQAHAATRPTTDLDACLRWTAENRERAAAGLAELNAGYRVEGMSERFPAPLDGRMLAGSEISTWRTDAGDIDYLAGIPTAEHGLGRLATYDDLAPRAQRMVIAGIPVDVASLRDIIDSKQSLDRPSDREALPELIALRDAPSEPSPSATSPAGPPHDPRNKPSAGEPRRPKPGMNPPRYGRDDPGSPRRRGPRPKM